MFYCRLANGNSLRDWSNIDSDIECEDGADVLFNVEEENVNDSSGGNISNEMEIGINRIFFSNENFPAAQENVQPAETAVPNANLSKTKSNNGRGRGEKLVIVANGNSGAAQEPEKSENWTEVDETFWPGNDTECFVQDAENDKLSLPANRGIREIHHATSGSPSARRFQFFSLLPCWIWLLMRRRSM